MLKKFQFFIWLMLFALLAGTQPAQAYHPVEPARPVSSAPVPDSPVAAGDELWDDQFLLGTFLTNQPGSYGNFAVAVSGTNVYVGGDFDHAGNVHSESIARWDATAHKWSTMGGGVNSRVHAIAALGDDVYAGGNFTTAGGISASKIAHWNEATQAWSAMGEALSHTSTSPEVEAVAIAPNGDVYLGGDFEKVGDLTVNNIARWDGSSWHALGAGTGGTFHDVLAIAINGNDVYIGGQFETAGGSANRNVAKWNGSAWSALGSGTGGSYPDVLAIAISGSNVYVAGEFDEVTDSTNGTQSVGHVAMWNGSVWNTLNGGLGDPDAAALAVGPDGVYVGGRFTKLADNTTSANRLARWDGSAWSSVGGSGILSTDGVDENVYALAFLDDQLYVGGMQLTTNNGRTLNRIGYYDIGDNEWYALGNSVNSPVYALAMKDDYVYLGGSFTSAGGVKSVGVARWNQRTGEWSTLSGGVSGCTGLVLAGCRTSVYAILVDGDDIYVGGNFAMAAGLDANGIARWNTTTQSWYTLGEGVSCSGLGCSAFVRAMSMTDTHLVVGGVFDYAGGIANPASNIAVWDGSNWAALGSGTNGTVYAANAVSMNEIYLGGVFSAPAVGMARWNGVAWVVLSADAIDGNVYAIKTAGSQMYAGGAFTNLGGSNGDFISSYHNSDWFQLAGDPLDNTVWAIDSIPEATFAGGEFTAAGALGISKIGAYTGSSWSGFGSGADSTVYAIASDSIAPYVYTLYIGGEFLNAGEAPSAYFGRYHGQQYLYLPMTMR